MSDRINKSTEQEQAGKKVYDIKDFGFLLKKIRQYRGFRYQSILARELNISRQVWSLWELGRRVPALVELAALANFLQVDACYFLTPGANPQDFDLLSRS